MNNLAAIPIAFAIRECKCNKFGFTEYGNSNKTIIPFDQYIFNFNLGLDIKHQEKLIIINLNSNLTDNSDLKNRIAEIESTHHFLIQNFEEVTIKKDDGTREIYDQVLIPFIAIALSNLRGMYTVKLEDSIYSNAVLPAVDATQFIPKKMLPVG